MPPLKKSPNCLKKNFNVAVLEEIYRKEFCIILFLKVEIYNNNNNNNKEERKE